MVSANTFLAASVALVAAIVNVEAAVSPTYPQPGTIQVQGETNDITWTFDGKDSDQTYQIDFMTGSNDNQTVLQTVATGVSASLLKYPFVAPAVDPYSAIYFFMFTGSKSDQAWTTRFGIVPDANTNLTAEPESTQPDGSAIPWGNGKLASNSTSNATSSAAVSSGAAVADTAAASSAPVSSAASAASEGTTVIPVAKAVAHTSAASAIKPALSFVAAGVAGYMMM
ncbi:hypothetical protein G6F56_005050 [Rhizopus delemar]|nr:hypothetical protein G6F56_005050 [Rhizopus delemar]